MALNYTELTATTQNYLYPKMVDNIFTSNVLLNRARKKWYNTRTGLGNKLVLPVAYATTSASEWYSGADLLTVSANDQVSAADFDWKTIHASISITGSDEERNKGKEGIINFVASKVQLAEKTIVDNLGTGLYNAGTTTNAIIGLRLAIDSAGTYGNIARGTYSWWAAQEDSTTAALSLGIMQGIYGDCTVGNSKPTVIVTTQDLYDLYWGKLQPQQRFQDTETAKAGFSNLMFNGAPVIVDGHCPSAHMFFINEDYIQFVVSADRNFKFTPFQQPVNQDVTVAHIWWMGALAVNNCRMHGKLGAITA